MSGLKGFAAGLSAPLKHGLLRSVRCVEESTPAIVSLGLATILTVLLPTLRDILRTELNVSSDRGVPSMFVFDIQDEQNRKFDELINGGTQMPGQSPPQPQPTPNF